MMKARKHSERVKSLRDRFSYQFARTFAFGLSIEPGWFGIIERVCEQVDDIVTKENVSKNCFSWLQVKEKFGGLSMYWSRPWNPPSNGGTNRYFNRLGGMNFEEGTSQEEIEMVTLAIAKASMVPEAASDLISAIVRAADDEARQTCQFCGAPGAERELPDGWLVAACEKHATREAIIEFRASERDAND